jgi:predicted phosphoadenosine phosphosulfate sulfurtransferase
VLKESYERVLEILKTPHSRIEVSYSGGKDSQIVLELVIMAARAMGKLPVSVHFCDEEACFPGTIEMIEQTASRPEITFSWMVCSYPQLNIFNRAEPYWWVFDDRLSSTKWMRPFHSGAILCKETSISTVVNKDHFPFDYKKGEVILSFVGIRTGESKGRRMGYFSSAKKSPRLGWVIKTHDWRRAPGVWTCWPIYDWTSEDVWKAIKEFHWPYNRAYDDMLRIGLPKNAMRIAPPTMMIAGLPTLRASKKLWPVWFDRLCERLPGVRQGAEYGRVACMPRRCLGETWQESFERECVRDAPGWIRDRAIVVRDTVLFRHRQHSKDPFPQLVGCPVCKVGLNSWETLAKVMYSGDPYQKQQTIVDTIQPKQFRPELNDWGNREFGWGRKLI